MKLLVWIVAVLLALAWTFAAAVLASMAGWLAANAGDMAGWAGQLSAWPPMEWLAALFGPEFVTWLRDAAASIMAWGSAALPAAGSLFGWLGPVIWVVWGLGLLGLLALAGGAHFAIARASASLRGQSAA